MYFNLFIDAEYDEGIERDSEDMDDEKFADFNTEELDYVLEVC